MKSKKVGVLIGFLFISIIAVGQSADWELGIMLGGSNYVGDINNMFKDGNDNSKEWNQFENCFNLYNAHLLGGLIARYNFNPRWSARVNLSFSELSGNDAHFDNIRNLNFHSSVQELSAVAEFNFFDYRTGSLQHRITPYFFAGLGLFHFNPKTEIFIASENRDMTINLHDYHTEGQTVIDGKNNYNLWQLSIPFGLGVKFSLSKYVCLGIEWGFRKTFTDYIDDISDVYIDRNFLSYNINPTSANASDRTNELDGYKDVYHTQGEMRGNATTDDWYNFFGITLTTKLSNGKNKCLKH